jgi:hypothetical protein
MYEKWMMVDELHMLKMKSELWYMNFIHYVWKVNNDKWLSYNAWKMDNYGWTSYMNDMLVMTLLNLHELSQDASMLK